MIFSGVVCRDFLDVHPAFGRGHDCDLLGTTVDDHPEIHLAGYVGRGFDQYAIDRLPLGAGLVCHQAPAEHVLYLGHQFVFGPDDFHAPGLAPATRVDLRLDQPCLPTELARDGSRFLDGFGRRAVRGRDPVVAKQLFRLILVQIQALSPVPAI